MEELEYFFFKDHAIKSTCFLVLFLFVNISHTQRAQVRTMLYSSISTRSSCRTVDVCWFGDKNDEDKNKYIVLVLVLRFS